MASHRLNTRSEEEETARNEVTRRIPEEFGVVEWTFDLLSIIMIENRQGEKRKSPKTKVRHENNAEFKTD